MVRNPSNPFRVITLFLLLVPGFSLRSNPGLKLANAFGVRSNSGYVILREPS